MNVERGDVMNYEEWLDTIPAEITQDTLWKVKAYRLALFAADLGWNDISRLHQDKRTKGLADQLYRALGSISVNIAEGYSKGHRVATGTINVGTYWEMT